MQDNSRFLQDTFHFTLTEEKTVTNDTVKISVNINALIQGKITDAKLREDIHTKLKSFIDTTWALTNMNRFSETGLEKVTLTASSRVPETENYNVKRRLEDLSKEGLQFTLAGVDTSIPSWKLEKTNAELREALLTKIVAEMESYKKILNNVNLRVHEVTFGNITANFSNNSSMQMAMATATYSAPVGGAAVPSLGISQKLSLTADVVLAAYLLGGTK